MLFYVFRCSARAERTESPEQPENTERAANDNGEKGRLLT